MKNNLEKYENKFTYIRRATADLDVAMRLYKPNPAYDMPFEIICYHCEQAAEKMIKAAIANLFPLINVPAVHNFIPLLKILKDNNVQYPAEYDIIAIEFKDYAGSDRYNNAADDELTELDCYNAINAAKDIFNFMLKLAELEVTQRYELEFPDYDDQIRLIDNDWFDSTVKADAMPSMSFAKNDILYKIYYDYKDSAKRHNPKQYRLTVNGKIILDTNSFDLLKSKTKMAIKNPMALDFRGGDNR